MSLKAFVVLYKTPDTNNKLSAQAVGAYSAEEASMAISEYLNDQGLGQSLILGVLADHDLEGIQKLVDDLKVKIDELAQSEEPNQK